MSEKKQSKSQEIAEEILDDYSDHAEIDLAKLKKLKKDEVGQLVIAMAKMTKSHSGPLPPSEDFVNYEKAQKGAAQRILNYAEEEQKHRHSMDDKLSNAAIQDTKRGQNFAFAIMILIIIAAFVCAITGNNIAAGLFIAPVVIGVVRKFIDGRSNSE